MSDSEEEDGRTGVKDEGSSGGDVGIVSDERINGMIGEVLSPNADWRQHGSPLRMLKEKANNALFHGLEKIFLTINSNIEKGHLPSVKLLMDLVLHLEKFGSIQPAEMQSFADLLIKSLEAETKADEPVVVEAGN